MRGAVRNVVGIRCGAFSGNMKVSFQAARSIGFSMGFVASVCQPSQRPPEPATLQQTPGRDPYLDGLLAVESIGKLLAKSANLWASTALILSFFTSSEWAWSIKAVSTSPA